MWANKPRIAKKFEKKTSDSIDLPEKVGSIERLNTSVLFNQLKVAAFKESEMMDPSSMMEASQNAERRKEDLHQLDVSFEEKKRELELQKIQLDIEKSKMEFALKMQEMKQKSEDQAMQRQQGLLSAAQGQQDLQQDQAMIPQQSIGDVDYKANLSQIGAKAAAYEDQYIHGYSEKVPFEGKFKPMATGTGLGVLGAQILPTDTTRALWDEASKIPVKSTKRNMLRAKGLGANLKRTGLGAGVGLLAGLLAHELMD